MFYESKMSAYILVNIFHQCSVFLFFCTKNIRVSARHGTIGPCVSAPSHFTVRFLFMHLGIISVLKEVVPVPGSQVV